MALSGVSTLGVTFGYGVETTAGTKPAAFTELSRINAIGGITLENQTIDSSALTDLVTQTIAGRADTPGNISVTVNLTPETKTEWATLISTYKALTDSKQMWFQTIIPGFTDSFFFIAQPPQDIPQPEMNQNELLTVEFSLTIVEYKGMDDKVAFT
jgi:hypothetical protein